jgi:hypothetical protein
MTLDDQTLDLFKVQRPKAAEDYARRGFHVVRLHGLLLSPDGKLVCDCDKGARCGWPGKHPHHLPGFMDGMPPTVEQVMEWWEEAPNSNVGLLTGGEWGLVLDLDLPRESNSANGVDAWYELSEIHGGAPATRVSITGSGGMHWWFQLPQGRTYMDEIVIGKPNGVDVKKTRGMVVAPPSLHTSGNLYRWQSEAEPTIAPSWLFAYDKSMQGLASNAPDSKGNSSGSQTTSSSLTWTEDQKRCGCELLDRISSSVVLPQKMARKIKYGTDQGGSELLFELCLEAARIGIGPVRLFAELIEPGCKGGDALRRRANRLTHQDIQDWFINYVYMKALLQISKPMAHIDSLIEGSKEFPFDAPQPREPSKDLVKVRPKNLRKVLDECLSIGRTTATLKPFLSQVQIAHATKLSTKTVMHSLRYLEYLGWIKTINKRDQHATQYRLADVIPK